MANLTLAGPDTLNVWGLESRLLLMNAACEFFALNKGSVEERYRLIGKEIPSQSEQGPFSVSDFLSYLNAKATFHKAPNAFAVVSQLRRMEAAGVLVSAPPTGFHVGGLNDRYFYLEAVANQKHFQSHRVKVLGPEYLYRLWQSGLVHISGVDEAGNPTSGTGFTIQSGYVVTCGHVIKDIVSEHKLESMGNEYEIDLSRVHFSSDSDVALIEANKTSLRPSHDLVFRSPVVAQTVYTIGFPKLTGLRDASQTIQEGAITNSSVTSFQGERLFLYSAISRPGNSGGPVVSDEGYVVGISTTLTDGEYKNENPFSPHYAGIPADVLIDAVSGFELGVRLKHEKYE